MSACVSVRPPVGRFVMSTVLPLPSYVNRLAVVTSSTFGGAGTESNSGRAGTKGSARVAGVVCGGSGAPRRIRTKSAKLVMIDGVSTDATDAGKASGKWPR